MFFVGVFIALCKLLMQLAAAIASALGLGIIIGLCARRRTR